MTTDYGLTEFAVDLQQRVISRQAENAESFREAAFVDVMIDYLGETGELEDAQVSLFRATGLQVSGWALGENEENLDLLVAIHTDEVPPRTIPQSELDPVFKRVQNFFARSCKGLQFDVEESTAAFDLCQRIPAVWNAGLLTVRFILITDGIATGKAPKAMENDDRGVRVSFHIRDIEWLYRVISSGRDREAIEIDFTKELKAPIPCLAQPASNDDYAAYLAIIPGAMLAQLYGLYGTRLLERNVRSFLQARGDINRGIRNTIRDEPHMFLAYNNGLSATAEWVDLVDLPGGGKGIARVRDLQIVNGGQTTASIYYALKKEKADLSALAVQVKLTVLKDPSKMDEVIPLISKYANSQNKIQQADLAANDSYHRRIEQISRTTWAPSTDGSQRMTRWYYERARGQFQDDIARAGTPGQQKRFLEEHPKSQCFGKTELAKYIVTWEQKPHIVSKGAQYCFSHLTNGLAEHLKAAGEVDQLYFQLLVVKAILFRSAEKLITERFLKPKGYTGYRANLVTYCLARLSHSWGDRLDLGSVWTKQTLSQGTEDAIVQIAAAAWSHITAPRSGANVTQYCKAEDCWKSFLEVQIPLPASLQQEFAARDQEKEAKRAGSSKPARPAAVVSRVPADVWFELAEWGKTSGHLTGLECKIICDVAIAISYGNKPIVKSAEDAAKLLERARKLGFRK